MIEPIRNNYPEVNILVQKDSNGQYRIYLDSDNLDELRIVEGELEHQKTYVGIKVDRINRAKEAKGNTICPHYLQGHCWYGDECFGLHQRDQNF